MPKVKPNKGVLKRVRVSARGKVKFGHAGKSHLNSTFSGKRIRQLRKPGYATAGDIKNLQQLLWRRLRPA